MRPRHKAVPRPPCQIALGRLLRCLWPYLRPYKTQGLLILAAMLLDLLFDTALRLSFKWLIDAAIVPRNATLLGAMLLGLAGGLVVAAGSALGRDYLYARLGTSVLNDLRLAMFTHLQHLSMRFYHQTPPGDILARFSTDLAAVEQALTHALPVGVCATLGVMLAVVPLFALAWPLAAFALVTLPLCVLGPLLLKQATSTASYRLKAAQGQVINTVQENLGAQAVVQAFGLQGPAIAGLQRQLQHLFRVGVRANFLAYLLERTPEVTACGLEILVTALGALLAYHGHLSIGDLVAFHVLFVGISQSVYNLTSTIPSLVHAAVGMQRLEELLHVPPEVTDPPAATVLPRLARALTLQHVTFGYTPEHPSLCDVSLCIPRGHFVALVGASGSGKSTLLTLLMRLYDPLQGTVSVDGVDVRRLTQASLRAQMGVVFQETVLLNLSVRENIRLGDAQATDADVEAAARAAEIHEAILGLPQGYDTLVGERGGRLSGGQRQRIALARALVRNPAILILDEATSALDPLTEAAITATLRRVARGRTVIAATHRLATITHADSIVVLRQGRVVEQGTHAALLQQAGPYAELWDTQRRWTFGDGAVRAHMEAQATLG